MRRATMSEPGPTRSYGTVSQAGNVMTRTFGREERQRLLQLLHAPVVARDVQQRAGRGAGLRLVDELGEHQRVEPFRHAGDDARGVLDRRLLAGRSFRLQTLRRPHAGANP